jgi:hypothetical protein
LSRVGHDRFPEESFRIGPTDTLVQGILEAAALEMHVLTHVTEKHREATVLAHRHALLRSDAVVFEDVLQYSLSKGGRFLDTAPLQSQGHIPGNPVIRLEQKFFHEVGHGRDSYGSHDTPPPSRNSIPSSGGMPNRSFDSTADNKFQTFSSKSQETKSPLTGMGSQKNIGTCTVSRGDVEIPAERTQRGFRSGRFVITTVRRRIRTRGTPATRTSSHDEGGLPHGKPPSS